MFTKKVPIFLTVLFLVLASLACQATGDATPAPANTPAETDSAPVQPAATEAAPQADAPAVPEPVSPKGAGMACLGLRDGGLSCLDENGWQTYNTENSDLPSNYVTVGALCPDDRVAIAHYDGVSLFDGKKWEHIGKTDKASSVDGMACGDKGEIWLAHFEGVSHYADGQWTTYGSDQLATGEAANQLVYDVEVAPDGKVWVVTSRSVALFEDGKWTAFQKGQGFEGDLFFNALTLDSTGRPWAGYSNGVAVYENGAWKLIEKSDYSSPEALAVDAKGQIWMGSLSGVSVFSGSTWSNYDRASEKLPSDNVKALAADSLGRVWMGTSYGLVVFDADNWQTYQMSTSDLADNYVEFVVVVNDGPTLPALADKEKASLTGKLEDADHKPLVGMQVEICVEPLGSQFSGATPCSDQPFSLSTKTDDQGVFLLADVPPGYYVLVAETGSGWSQLTDQFGIGSERTLVKPGEKHDIGTLTLEKQ